MEKENEKNLIRINDYLVLSLNNYKGNYSVLEGNIGREDGNYHSYPCQRRSPARKRLSRYLFASVISRKPKKCCFGP